MNIYFVFTVFISRLAYLLAYERISLMMFLVLFSVLFSPNDLTSPGQAVA
jgi:hypothetical protein